MHQVIEFFKGLLSTADWPPRWHCGNWSDFHGWLYIISDLLVWSAYFAIPLLIIKYISKRKEVKFHRIYFLFAAFILACGCTHFLDAVAFWYPAYRLNAVVLFITGVVSWVTVYYLIKLLPQAFSMKSSEQLETEVEQRKNAEEELMKRNAYLIEAEEMAKLGYWEWNFLTDELIWSEGLFRIFGTERDSRELSYAYFLEKIFPDDRAYVDGVIKAAIEKKEYTEHYYRIACSDGLIKTVHAKGQVVLNGNNEVKKLVGTLQDVTEQKKAEDIILSKSMELETLNTELQQFAYVASHDLQEPLRKIRMYASLLESKVKNQQSDNGNEYLEKIISSSVRMQNLINNILEFSRLSTDNASFSQVDLNTVLHNVISNLEVSIEKTNARITIKQLPVIEGNSIQLGQLFQNLLSNAIKFARNNEVPKITVSAEIIEYSLLPDEYVQTIQSHFQSRIKPGSQANDLYCKIYVTDEGIGFDETYLEKIFTIFQRLHSKHTYEGTGIGLAICKRVVENYHGLITAKSKHGEGATFIIVLPLVQKVVR